MRSADASKTGTPLPPSLRGDGIGFFLIGADRSGTTLLRVVLNAHPNVRIPPETWWLIDLLKTFGTDPEQDHSKAALLSLVTAHPRWKDWDIHGSVLEAAVARLPERVNIPTLIAVLYALACGREGNVIVGDKTPEYVIHVKSLSRLFPRAKFVHIVRDPRDVVLSLLRAGFRGFDLFRVAAYWRWYVGRGLKDGQALGAKKVLLVRYESLILKTEETLRELCEFLGIEFHPGMLEYYRTADVHIPSGRRNLHTKLTRLPQPGDVERWRHEMTPDQQRCVEEIVGPLAVRLGYRMETDAALLDWRYLASMCVEWPLVMSARWRERFGFRRSDDARKAKRDAYKLPKV